MKVAIVAEQLRRSAPGGIGTYVRGLLAGIGSLGPDAPDAAPWTSPLPGPLATRSWDRGLGRGPRADLVHAPSLAFPPTRAPLVVTVHDVAWRAGHGVPERGRAWHEAGLRRAQRAGATLLVPDERLAAALRDEGAARVRTLDGPLYGCDHLPPPDEGGAGAVLERLGVTGPFVLSVATLEPRKNLARLVDAFGRARPQMGADWSLVVVGAQGWGDALPPAPSVHLAGRVDDAVVAALYRRASLVAYVPLLEGFGLPAVEAMHAGVAVVASAVPSVESSVGDAALVVDPADADAIAGAIVAVATEPALRASLIDAGTRHASGLTWSAAARRHVELWRDVAGGER